MTAELGCDEWEHTLNNLVAWAESIPSVTAREAFNKIAEILKKEHFGVESISLEHFDDMDTSLEAPSMEYLNMGDTYALTLVLTDDYVNGVKLLVTTWGDWYESTEQHHCKEYGYVRCGYCSHFTPFEYADDDGNGGDDWHNHQCEHCKNNVSGGEFVPVATADED